MFTGIIEAVSRVNRVKRTGRALQLEVAKPRNWRISAGASIAVNGVCSTAILAGRRLGFHYMPGTLKVTALSRLRIGDRVNLERSLPVSGRWEGHFVYGHIDAIGTVSNLTRRRGETKIQITLPANATAPGWLITRGAIALNGVSLTIFSLSKKGFTVAITPFTKKHTALGLLPVGDRVNLEFDQLAKIVSACCRESPRFKK
ncbi:MAG: riboflavin synthase [Candidatus Magasanikbacteria bacterium]|nr:riboflavin synthase [Candidatus Magasanikbacteria bacterium]